MRVSLVAAAAKPVCDGGDWLRIEAVGVLANLLSVYIQRNGAAVTDFLSLGVMLDALGVGSGDIIYYYVMVPLSKFYTIAKACIRRDIIKVNDAGNGVVVVVKHPLVQPKAVDLAVCIGADTPGYGVSCLRHYLVEIQDPVPYVALFPFHPDANGIASVKINFAFRILYIRLVAIKIDGGTTNGAVVAYGSAVSEHTVIMVRAVIPGVSFEV